MEEEQKEQTGHYRLSRGYQFVEHIAAWQSAALSWAPSVAILAQGRFTLVFLLCFHSHDV